jgi:ribosomal protein L7/L12
MRPWTTVADPVSISQDFAHLQGLSREEQQKQLRELAQRGETIAAIYTARKLYRCSLEEARAMVEEFRNQPVS